MASPARTRTVPRTLLLLSRVRFRVCSPPYTRFEMERTAANQPGQSPAAVHVTAAITTLQHHVQAWIDGDRLLPADGASLLALLDQALEALAAGDMPAAHTGITASTRRIE